jgi:hypothetical protein
MHVRGCLKCWALPSHRGPHGYGLRCSHGVQVRSGGRRKLSRAVGLPPCAGWPAGHVAGATVLVYLLASRYHGIPRSSHQRDLYRSHVLH